MLNYFACGAWALVALLLFANIALRIGSLPAISSDHYEVLESRPIPKQPLATMPKSVAGLGAGRFSTPPTTQSESAQPIAQSEQPTIQSESTQSLAQSESKQLTTTQPESTHPSVQTESAQPAVQSESPQSLAQSEPEILGSITSAPPAARVKAQPKKRHVTRKQPSINQRDFGSYKMLVKAYAREHP